MKVLKSKKKKKMKQSNHCTCFMNILFLKPLYHILLLKIIQGWGPFQA